jgi:tetraacyldisaccharide 4'-kinase
MRARIEKFIITAWDTRNFLTFLLLPISYLYKLCFQFHKLCYRIGIKKQFVSSLPVIVIGNITLGGTGKTPLTIALVRFLIEQGYQPGIISRGYKGKAKAYPEWVTPASDPYLVGDEPVLIASKTGCPVVVSPQRAKAITMLLEKSRCDLIISDDGLQHHALKKDLEIILVDGERKFGNGWCFPAGPLREPIKRLSNADFVIYYNNRTSPYFISSYQDAIYNLLEPSLILSTASLSNVTIHAVAAIAYPERFFNSLQQMGLRIKTYVFSDHHQLSEEDLLFCGTDDILIMTEKDAVKCRRFARSNFWVLPIYVEMNSRFKKDFLTCLGQNRNIVKLC